MLPCRTTSIEYDASNECITVRYGTVRRMPKMPTRLPSFSILSCLVRGCTGGTGGWVLLSTSTL